MVVLIVVSLQIAALAVQNQMQQKQCEMFI